MLWPGTLIGAGAGFAIASIPGALLGALLGQALDRRLQLHSWAQLRERLGGRPALRNDELLFVLLGRLAKAMAAWRTGISSRHARKCARWT